MGFFAREGAESNTQYLQINTDFAKQKIDELSAIIFTPPQSVKNLDNELLALKKGGILHIDFIFEFVKIIKYFLYLKNLNTQNLPHLRDNFEAIKIPNEILKMSQSFENDGGLKSGQDGEIWKKFDALNISLKSANAELKRQLNRILSNPKLTPYLVDKSAHFIDGYESLLLSGGFGAVLKGRILQRTQGGFFYILPQSLQSIYERIDKLRNEREIVLYEIEKMLSNLMAQNLAFLKFINAEFDRFDALQARVRFAKEKNLEFIAPTKNAQNAIILQNFYHPNLNNPTPCNVDFGAQILLITGVNAGGKTMLLKSILSASFLSNLLIPFKINPHKSQIPPFSAFEVIINDPQDSKNDISTFAGRMVEFSNILAKIDCAPKDEFMLLGIDEIELGTDANEASALYFAILQHLECKNIKIIITTHHKILASKMADSASVELLAALYDEKNRTPNYEFLKGAIGKSYAFESALKYGIPRHLIQKAQKIYDENLENLNVLVEQSAQLKADLSAKEALLSDELRNVERKKDELNALIDAQNAEFAEKKAKLEATYKNALNELKAALKQNDSRAIHRLLNAQHREFQALPKESAKKHIDFKAGERVALGKSSGVILRLSGENALLELENGVRVRSKISALQKTAIFATTAQKISVSKSAKTCAVCLDLHGKRAEEAIEMLDLYISDCLMAGFSEVIIKHGIGSGVLSAVVRDFLSAHPKVVGFEDAPPNLGGFGAKIVRL